MEVTGDQAAFGSSRSGWSGKAARSARIASTSSSGGKTPPFSLSAVNPYSSTRRRACRTMPSGSSASPQPSGVLARVRRPLVEEVGRERHRVPDRAAQQVGDRAAGRLALDVQARDLERGEHRVGGRGVADRPRRDRVPALPDDAGDPAVDLLGVVRVHAHDGVRDRAQRRQVVVVGVGLAEPGQPAVGGDLDHRAERERLVHADRVQQRRIGERDRGDRDAADPQGVAAHAPTAASPTARMPPSSSRCSGDGSTSGGRTLPASSPRSFTPALTSETA